MALRLVAHSAPDVRPLVEDERRLFAAKMRVARAVLGWSQSVLARRAGMSQRAVHKLEQGETEPRRSTFHVLEQIWRDEGLQFIPTADGFQFTVSAVTLARAEADHNRHRVARFDAGVTTRGDRAKFRSLT
jgi:transcriptional regulator with XRE-family HTH domain